MSAHFCRYLNQYVTNITQIVVCYVNCASKILHWIWWNIIFKLSKKSQKCVFSASKKLERKPEKSIITTKIYIFVKLFNMKLYFHFSPLFQNIWLSWPTQNVYVSFLEEGQFGSMDRSVILLKYIISTIHTLSKRQEIIFKHFHIICCFLLSLYKG